MTHEIPAPRIFHQDDRATIYHDDALLMLASLPDESVDALITDPPYSGGSLANQKTISTTSKYGSDDKARGRALPQFAGDSRDQASYAYWTQLWLAQALRVTKPGGFAMVFTDWRQYGTTALSLQGGSWLWRGTVTWVKPRGNARPMKGRFNQPCEYVLWGTKGARHLDQEPGFKMIEGWFEARSPMGKQRVHTTEKPVDFMEHLMLPLEPDSLVLDPFAGSGTTGVAAMNCGHRCIGCEVVEQYAQTATDRITQAQNTPRLIA